MRPLITRSLIVDALVHKKTTAIENLVDGLMPIVRCNVVRVLIRKRTISRGRNLGQEVDDLTQEVFSYFLADRGARLLAWNSSIGSASTYFGLLARRHILNIFSNRKRSPWTETPMEQTDFDKDLGDNYELERQLIVRDLLGKIGEEFLKGLNERDQLLFRRLYVDNAEDEHVRTELGLGSDALYKARSRLLRRAKDLAEGVLNGGCDLAGVLR